ncbi:helix-turn-helix transcriptional regulator [Phytoactinopolyspora limicola]|uniref:helix-turn-helix transcriptional regulator n=1 Tax=Phytoactinopolyspora limicola TaxID=2715536 RepID=UPI00140CC232|nr:AraC family transcriptional regulator [Phytoactinopolyspora limicola]
MAASGGWDGRFGVIQPGWHLYLGAVGPANEHAHHAIQVVLSDTPMVLQDSGGYQRRCTAAVIPANAPHTIVKGAAEAVMLYLEPEGTAGRTVSGRWCSDPGSIDTWTSAANGLTNIRPGQDKAWARTPESLAVNILGVLGVADTHLRGDTVHPAVGRALRSLPDMLDGPVRLADVGAEVGLSASRLRHLFAGQVGLPFRRYVLWLRLQRAADEVLGGASLTEAAHAAGFADSSHLTKVTHRTFGLPPSTLVKAVTPLVPD